MDNFIAIDVETANYSRSSICAIGAVKVIDGIIIDKKYTLVSPEPEWFHWGCVKVHGITSEDVMDAPSFGTVWEQWQPWLEGFPLVAHNAAFDSSCISAACDIYGLIPPEDPFYCTLIAARKMIPRGMLPSKSLDSLCEYFGIPLHNHHNALEDAEACAKLAIVLI